MALVSASAQVPLQLPSPLTSSCINEHQHCEFWAGLEECQANPKWMMVGVLVLTDFPHPTTDQFAGALSDGLWGVPTEHERRP